MGSASAWVALGARGSWLAAAALAAAGALVALWLRRRWGDAPEPIEHVSPEPVPPGPAPPGRAPMAPARKERDA